MSTPARAQLDTAVNNLQIQVSRDNVLQVRAALLAEAARLDTVLRTEVASVAKVGLCGNDPISPPAAAGFNARINALINQCRAYNSDLRDAANAINATAQGYGFTEEEIAASFKETR